MSTSLISTSANPLLRYLITASYVKFSSITSIDAFIYSTKGLSDMVFLLSRKYGISLDESVSATTSPYSSISPVAIAISLYLSPSSLTRDKISGIRLSASSFGFL